MSDKFSDDFSTTNLHDKHYDSSATCATNFGSRNRMSRRQKSCPTDQPTDANRGYTCPLGFPMRGDVSDTFICLVPSQIWPARQMIKKWAKIEIVSRRGFSDFFGQIPFLTIGRMIIRNGLETKKAYVSLLDFELRLVECYSRFLSIRNCRARVAQARVVDLVGHPCRSHLVKVRFT